MSSRSYTCASCARRGADVSALCAQCQTTRYCNRDCQKQHWKEHKKTCVPKGGVAPPKKKAVAASTASASASATAAAVASSSSGSSSADLDAIQSAPTIAALAAAVSASSVTSSSSSSSSANVAPTEPLGPIEVTFSLPSSESVSHPLLEVRDLPGRGRGFVAAAAIAPGTLLFTEESVYAHSEGVGSSEDRRVQTLAALTRVMLERYPAALQRLCRHADHEVPDHSSMSTPPDGVSLDAWHDAVGRVDSNQFTSARGMMLSPAVATANHSCYPNADLIIREVPAATDDEPTRTIEQVSIYAIQAIEAGAEVTINYLGSDSLCRWYAPSMIRQESFTAQWQFECDCGRCRGTKARAIDKTLAYAPSGMDDAIEQRYTQLVLAENASPSPAALLQLYRDMYTQLHGERFSHHYLLHQIRTMLLFMPAAFVEESSSSSSGKSTKQSSANKFCTCCTGERLSGEAEWLQLVQHHLQTLASHLLNPPFHSIKSDSVSVMLRACDHIGATRDVNATKSHTDKDIVENRTLRVKVAEIAHDCDATYLEEATFATLYPDTHKLLLEYVQSAMNQQ